MLKKTIIICSFPIIIYAQTITQLFDALKNHSQTKVDEMMIKKAHIEGLQATSKLYPTINIFGSYDNYSTPTGMIPIAPNYSAAMLKDQSISQPFSYNIYKAGANFTLPIFVKSIFTYAKKAKVMQKSAKSKKNINLCKNEAIIVGTNAQLKYLSKLKSSLILKEKSLKETEKTLKIKVDNGRSPASSLYKIDDSLNQIKIAKNNIELQKNKLISSIEAITGIRVEKPIDMTQVQTYTQNDLESLKPIKDKIIANRLDIQAQREKLYPSVVAHGSYVFSQANAYNNHQNTDEEYGDIGILINIPLLAMSQYDEIKKSALEVKSNEIELQKLTDELDAKANMLKNSLNLYDNSIKLLQKSVQNKIQLLKIAKLNYKNARLSTEEYLRYEDDVVDAKAKLYQTKAQKWQTLMELAVIYANNIEEMVK